jgi:hypothetical protein
MALGNTVRAKEYFKVPTFDSRHWRTEKEVGFDPTGMSCTHTLGRDTTTMSPKFLPLKKYVTRQSGSVIVLFVHFVHFKEWLRTEHENRYIHIRGPEETPRHHQNAADLP